MSLARRARAWLACYENRVLLQVLASGATALGILLALLWWGGYSTRVRWTFSTLAVLAWWTLSFSVRDRIVSPLRTLANLLEAIREGDYSIRGRGAGRDDALGEVMAQVNAMGATLRSQRLGAVEAVALLRTVMEELDVAVFTFDPQERLRLVNRAGERLLAAPAGRLLSRKAGELGLGEFLAADSSGPVTRAFPGASGRWSVRHSTFREGGLPLTLLVIADVTRVLREEELLAWQRLVRVLGHELNNSLTPIKSIASSLATLLQRERLPADWRADATSGLAVISARAEALGRFTSAYARLAKLPQPRPGVLSLGPLIHRVAGLETRLAVAVEPGPEVTLNGDADQLEQVLINLVRNAADAAIETGGGVVVRWSLSPGAANVSVLDDGLGLANTANLFVPFFTTKPDGSGIGLVLSRQIAEAHGGSLSLANRPGRPGCEARLVLPV
jgi:nitrogen fixation/metabolism regulation signal transduction histidine kinase